MTAWVTGFDKKRFFIKIDDDDTSWEDSNNSKKDISPSNGESVTPGDKVATRTNTQP